MSSLNLPSPPSKLPDARIANHGIAIAPLLDNFHVMWLESEKERWVLNGLITKEQQDLLCTHVGFLNTAPGMKGCHSKREIQDVYLHPKGAKKPSLVIVSGAKHDEREMIRDMSLWMKKGKGHVRKVILMIWIMLSEKTISGRIEAYDYDHELKNGILTEDRIFISGDPIGRSESVRVKLGDLFGSSDQTLTEEEREREVGFAMESLRQDAIEAITSSNLQVPDSNVPLHAFENPERPKVKRHVGNRSTAIDSYKTLSSHNTTIDRSNNVNVYICSDRISTADIQTIVHNTTSTKGIFLGDPKELETKCLRFAKNIGPALQELKLDPRHSTALCTVGLYDVIMLCDDSSSMSYGNRSELLEETVLRILPVATRLNEAGVSLRFINYKFDCDFDGLMTKEAVERALRIAQPCGTTMIGTVLRDKIVNPILAKARANKLLLPVLVAIITDGEPFGEPIGALKSAIIHCKTSLVQIAEVTGRGYTQACAVVFQLSYVGDSLEAKGFIHDISADPEVKDMVYCNLKSLDEQLANKPSEMKTGCLLELLSAAINKSMGN